MVNCFQNRWEDNLMGKDAFLQMVLEQLTGICKIQTEKPLNSIEFPSPLVKEGVLT